MKRENLTDCHQRGENDKGRIIQLVQSEINKSSCEVLCKGILTACDTSKYEYKIVHGRSIEFAIQCDKDWKSFMINTLSNLKMEYSECDFLDIADSLPFHDSHWDWFRKYRILNESAYDWFYIIADGTVQAVCITHHPRESLFDKKDIFYIEYIAVAPWNRKSDFIERKFQGLGTLLIKMVCQYFCDVHHYRYGFSLSAVPQAKGFYESIGMTAFPAYDYDLLSFYEINEENAKNFVGGAK